MTKTLKITIEPLDWKHEPHIQKYASDKAVSATTANIPYPYPPEGAKFFIRHILENRAKGLDHVFAVLADGSFVGLCGIAVNLEKKEAEIGYWIGVPFWGRGCATEGTRQVLRFAFEDLGLVRVEAHCFSYNIGSFRVMEKNGFQYLGMAPRLIPKLQRDEIVRRCELTKEDWLRTRK